MKGQIKYKFLLTIGLLFLTTVLFGQKDKIDSLESALLTAKSNESRSSILNDLFAETQANDVNKALIVAQQFRNLNKMRNSTSSKNYLQGYNVMGIAYMNLSQYDSALFYFQNLLDASEVEKDSQFISKAYNNLGAINFETNNYSSAVYYMNKATEIDGLIGDEHGALIGYMNIGAIYVALENTDSARYFLYKAEEIAKFNNEIELLSNCYLNLGSAEEKDGNFDKAKAYNELSLNYAKTIENYDLVSSAYRNLGIIFQKQGKFADALYYDFNALDYAQKSNALDNIINAHRGLALSYEKLGQYKEALSNYRTFMNLQDSLDDLESEDRVIEMQEKYKADQALKENQILSQKTKIQDLEIAKNAEEIENSRIVIVSSIVGLILLVVLAITLYNRNIIKQRANHKLQEANAIIQEKNSDILASIEYASKIQEALLPTKDDANLFPDSFFLLRPKDIVSGDFLWYTEISGKKIFAAVDCTGHGVPGAFMSMIGNTFLHQIINERGLTKPSEILNELRSNVIRAMNQKGVGVNRKDGMDMAICVYDKSSNKLDFAGANNPLILIRNGEFKEIKGDKQPVGYFEGKEAPFTNHTVDLKSGDCIYIMSDGYVDQFGGPKGKKFKYKNLIDLLIRYEREPMQKQKQLLSKAFDDWKGNLEQVDDVCLVGVRIV